MDSVRILKFLKEVAANNCKPWMDAHRDEYLACRSEFEKGIADAIAAIAQFDTSVAHLTPKDCIFRFNRDTTNATSAPTSPRTAEKGCTQATTYTCNRTTACSPVVPIGCRRLSSPQCAMRSWEI